MGERKERIFGRKGDKRRKAWRGNEGVIGRYIGEKGIGKIKKRRERKKIKKFKI